MMKILFFDIDGTLTNESTGLVPKSCIKAINEARKNGHLCFVNTGRPISTIPRALDHLELDGFVCGCGSYIEYQGKVLFKSNLTVEKCKEIVLKTKENHISAILEGSEGVYYEVDNQNQTIEQIKINYHQEGFDMSKTWDDDDICFDKGAFWLNDNSDFETFHQYMSQSFEGIKRADDFYEYIQKEYSKATGIQFLLDYFDLKLEDAYAFGDSTNDLSMLEYVKHSTAMGNAQAIVKEQVEYITSNVEDDGIYKALQYWGIID